jgi:hypothetical protein
LDKLEADTFHVLSGLVLRVCDRYSMIIASTN